MIFLSLVLSHLLADFYFQTDKMVRNKNKYLNLHVMHHFILTLITLGLIWSLQYKFSNFAMLFLLPVISIVVLHYLIDYIKIKLLDLGKSRKYFEHFNSDLYFFIIDQILHFLTIIVICKLYFDMKFSFFINRVIEIFTNNGYQLNQINTLITLVIILILTTSVSGHIIKFLLGSMPNQLSTFEGKYLFKNERKEDVAQESPIFSKSLVEEYNYMIIKNHDLTRGKVIGYIERILVVLLTYNDAFPAIAFIVTAKSIARFKQMDDRDWAEYFLLGTLTSMLFGITFGFILKGVLK
ncbi:DUF3307 domain-containing protein [Gottfriedia sp. NPDC056225]|uniref:DUF3307 domain-containing protein n=1 Tax=Gottfriedia sp. NPDC056225 TaxID=3345751 RepID=UPI0035E01F06